MSLFPNINQGCRFNKENLRKESGGYVMFYPPQGKAIIVARFKYRSPAGSFMTLLRNKFTIEEYFTRLNLGETPVAIAESKGYISPHVKRMLKQKGYPLTKAGEKQFLQDQVAAWEASKA